MTTAHSTTLQKVESQHWSKSCELDKYKALKTSPSKTKLTGNVLFVCANIISRAQSEIDHYLHSWMHHWLGWELTGWHGHLWWRHFVLGLVLGVFPWRLTRCVVEVVVSLIRPINRAMKRRKKSHIRVTAKVFYPGRLVITLVITFRGLVALVLVRTVRNQLQRLFKYLKSLKLSKVCFNSYDSFNITTLYYYMKPCRLQFQLCNCSQ